MVISTLKKANKKAFITMRTYKLDNKKGTLITNCYINLSYVKETKDLLAIADKEVIDSNINDFNKFSYDLINFEEANINGVKKNSNKCYGIILTFLLEKEQKKADIKALVSEIIKHYNCLPYVSFTSVKGKGNYLYIYLCERYYNANGYVKQVKAKKDTYRNSKTGKACKKDDANAILWHQKGDIISQKEELFSSKVRTFRYSNAKQFYRFIEDLKLYFIDLCVRVFKTIKETGITFKKYVLAVLSIKQKSIARVWHKAFYSMEADFIKAYEVLNNTGYIDDAKADLDKLFIKYNSLIHNNKHYYNNGENYFIPLTYKKVNFSIDFNNNYKQAKQDAKLLIDRFKEELDNIVFSYLPTTF